MKLIYHCDWRGNFGDDPNIPFFDQIIPDYKLKLPSTQLYGIGTLLNNNRGEISNAYIFGSGFGYGEHIEYDVSTTKIFGVRGPLTAKALGLDSEKYVIGDPAMYVSRMPDLLRSDAKAHKKRVFAMHHRTAELWSFDEDQSDLTFLDPGLATIPEYIEIIRGASLVFAESLHAAIIAFTFGVPFIPVAMKGGLDSRKWRDFYALIKVEPIDFSPVSAPSFPYLRRAMISARDRELVKKIGRRGVVVTDHETKRVVASLSSIQKQANPIVSDLMLVGRLQDKIERSIDLLREDLAHR